ncbi:MAG: YhcN/YlaJ family sporulation lipoprotein [Christensenellales bacterium]
MNKKTLVILILLLIPLFVFAGCAVSNTQPSPTPKLSVALSPTAMGTPVLSPSGSAGMGASASPGVSPVISPAGSQAQPTAVMQVLNTVKNVAGVQDAVAAVSGNKCVVGIKLKSGSAESTVKTAVAEAIRNAGQNYQNIAVTADAALYTEISGLANSPDAAAKIDTLLGKIK